MASCTTRVGGALPGTVTHGQVLAADLARGDHPHDRIHHGALAGDDHEAAGVLVEPVDDARTRHVASPRIQREQAVEQRAAPVAGSGVDDQAGRLVDDAQVLVLVHGVQRHGFRAECLALGRGPQFDRKHVAGLDARRRLGCRTAVDQHPALAQQLLEIAAGELGHQLGQRLVEPDPVLRGRCLHDPGFRTVGTVFRFGRIVRQTLGEAAGGWEHDGIQRAGR